MDTFSPFPILRPSFKSQGVSPMRAQSPLSSCFSGPVAQSSPSAPRHLPILVTLVSPDAIPAPPLPILCKSLISCTLMSSITMSTLMIPQSAQTSLSYKYTHQLACFGYSTGSSRVRGREPHSMLFLCFHPPFCSSSYDWTTSVKLPSQISQHCPFFLSPSPSYPTNPLVLSILLT